MANHILRMHDDDGNGQLDFEEFYRMSLRQEWLFSRLLVKYCKLIVPSPHRPEQDEIGKTFSIFENRRNLIRYIYVVCTHIMYILLLSTPLSVYD